MSQLSVGCTPHPSMNNPILHKGWEIYKWTGWKGNTSTLEAGDSIVKKTICCTFCGKRFKPGDRFIEEQGTDDVFHFECSDSPIKGQIFSQWVAIKKTGREGEVVPIQIDEANGRGRIIKMERMNSDWRYVYASAPGGQGEYKPFELFDIEVKAGQSAFTPETPCKILDAAREDALLRLKAVIDDIENQEGLDMAVRQSF